MCSLCLVPTLNCTLYGNQLCLTFKTLDALAEKTLQNKGDYDEPLPAATHSHLAWSQMMGLRIVARNVVDGVEGVEAQWEVRCFSFRKTRAKVGKLAFLEGWRGIDNVPRDDIMRKPTVPWECPDQNRELVVVGWWEEWEDGSTAKDVCGYCEGSEE